MTATQLDHPGVAHRPEATSIQGLFARMRAGDRDAASEFMRLYGDRIRRRVRGKMNTPMRRLFDSQEIMSTIGRRLDRFVHSGTLSARDEAEFWGFVVNLARRAVVDKARLFARLQRVESEDSEFAMILRQRLESSNTTDTEVAEAISHAIRQVSHDETDRTILQFWMQGESHTRAANLLGITPEQVRKRWERIRSELRVALNGTPINRRGGGG